ncbi:MAG: cytochrome c class [Gaiellaceae bacterium]|nr:cytochrome c class [Gaiellaceae bacterium]
MLIAVTTTGKIVLVLAAGIFIVFAIVSSFVLPRRNPDYPGNRLGAFIALTLVLFVALIGAMVVFAGESEEEEAGGEAESTQPAGSATETTGTETEPTETATTETGGGETGEETPAGGEGDAAAGEEVFAANGCGSCHTLEEAGASGSIGPNLDESQPSFELAVDRVTNGAGAMPAFGDSLSEEQIRDVAAYVVASTQ